MKESQACICNLGRRKFIYLYLKLHNSYRTCAAQLYVKINKTVWNQPIYELVPPNGLDYIIYIKYVSNEPCRQDQSLRGQAGSSLRRNWLQLGGSGARKTSPTTHLRRQPHLRCRRRWLCRVSVVSASNCRNRKGSPWRHQTVEIPDVYWL